MKVFKHISPFFLLNSLKSVDAIIRLDLLTQAGVKLNLAEDPLKYQGVCEKLRYFSCPSVNFIVNGIVVPASVKKEFKNTILRRKKAFSASHEALPFNTAVTVTIRTVDNETMYSRAYPNHRGVSVFVNNEVK